MKVGALCTREVVTCRARDTALDAAKLIRQHHVGDLIALDDREGQHALCGIVTDRDLVVAVMANGVDPASVFVSEVMSSPLVVACETDGVDQVLRRMRLHGVRRVPVTTDKGELVGIVSVDDLLDAVATLLDDLRRVSVRQTLFEKKGRA